MGYNRRSKWNKCLNIQYSTSDPECEYKASQDDLSFDNDGNFRVKPDQKRAERSSESNQTNPMGKSGLQKK